jgi:predicted PurR-regulated permease PerM
MLIVGVCTYVGLTIIGVPYSLPLSVMAALLEAVPMIGPLLAAGPAVLVAFSISPFTGIATTALAFFIQQFENYVFVPKVMERSVGITPLATLIALTIGARFAGIIGVLISVPTMIVLLVFFERYFLRKRPSVRS